MTASGQGASRVATRKDVAREAGVSAAVVSYVINHGPKRVAPATAARVMAAVELLGYQPNLTARALSSGSTRVLGLVLPDLLNPFFAEMAHAIESAAAECDFRVMLSHSNGQTALERQRVSELEARQVDGLLVSTLLAPRPLHDWADERRTRRSTPLVLLGYPHPIAGLATIGAQMEAGARSAVEHLVQHGHRRIGLVTGSDPGSTEARDVGWQRSLASAGLAKGPVGRGHYTRESGYALAQPMLASKRRPTAIFAASDLLAIGVLRAAHELGLKLPDDLALISFDGSSESEYAWPPLTAVRQPLQEMAAAAVGRLVGAEPAPMEGHETFPTTLIIRRSCGCSTESP